MKHIQQPSGSSICGQCCVAMITGLDLNSVISQLGNGKTTIKKLLTIISIYTKGTKMMRNFYGTPPKDCLMKLKWGDGRTHWVLRWDSMVHDPVLDKAYHYLQYLKMIEGDGRITSYLPFNKHLK